MEEGLTPSAHFCIFAPRAQPYSSDASVDRVRIGCAPRSGPEHGLHRRRWYVLTLHFHVDSPRVPFAGCRASALLRAQLVFDGSSLVPSLAALDASWFRDGPFALFSRKTASALLSSNRIVVYTPRGCKAGALSVGSRFVVMS